MSAKRTREDLTEAFRRRMRLMRSAEERFDAGDEDAGYDLAVHLRVLLHDTSQSHSILAQLGVKDYLLYPDGAEIPPPQVDPPAAGTRKIMISMFAGPWTLRGGDAKWRLVAPLDRGGAHLPLKGFEDWWVAPCGHDRNGNVFSRRDLVTDAANLDGAHVAPTLKGKYVALTRDHSLGVDAAGPEITISPTGAPDQPIEGNPALIGIRHVAFEVNRALARPQWTDPNDPSQPAPDCVLCGKPIVDREHLFSAVRRDQETQETLDIGLFHRACWDAW